jgi:hypothetical protein
MREKDWLFTSPGKDFLVEQYQEHLRSTYEIAEVRGTHANTIRRALLYHGIPIRDKQTAQINALRRGRATHPTSGIGHTDATKAAISNSITNHWNERKSTREQASS